MKVVLIQPCLSLKERYGKALGKVGPSCEPLGLAYLAAAIRNNDYEVEIIDASALNYTNKQLIEHLKKSKPDLVGISILTPMYLRAKETIHNIKKSIKNIKIVVGGPHVTVFPKLTLEENPEIDFAIYGEAEHTIVEVLDALEKKSSLKKIKGLVLRDKDKVIINPAREIIKDIDTLSFPARDLLPMKIYRPAPTYFNKLPSYLILTSRGCPYNCSYCSKVMGNVYRAHSVKRVIEEMELLIDIYNAKEIIFRDDTFTVNRQRVEDLCDEIIKRKIHEKIKWTCMSRVNLVDLELLQKMKKAGCWSMHFGIESGSQRLLDLIQKGIKLEQSRNAIKWARKAGIETKAFFMIGLPTETKEESLATIKFSKELDPDWVQFTITTPYPGTKLYNITKKDGTLKSFKWEDYQTWAGWSNKDLVYVPEGRNADELKELQRYAMRSFYFRPKFILRQIKNINHKNIKLYLNGFYALLKSGIKKCVSKRC